MTTPRSDRGPARPTRRERRAAERLERRQDRRPARRRSTWQSPALLATIGAVAVGLAIIAFAVATGGAPSGPGSTDDLVPPANPLPPGIPADGATLGRPEAPVTVEVWADFQCPACGHFARETEPQLIRTFVAAGQVKLVHRDFAFLGRGRSYDESVEAAAAARCAGRQGRFWDYEAWLYANQRGENAGAFTRQRLTAIAERIGLDVAAWSSCMDAGAEQAAVRAETQEGAGAGISSTPTILVGGTPYVGALPYEQLATIIRGLLPAASPAASPVASPSP